MLDAILESSWIILGLLTGLLVTMVLYVLAAQRRNALAIHDHVVHARAMRTEYLKALEERHAKGVDIEE